MQNRIMRRAFSLIELSFVIVLMSILTSIFIMQIKNTRQDKLIVDEAVAFKTLENGIKDSFLHIIKSYQSTAYVGNDSSSTWGYSNRNMRGTSPLPIFNSISGFGNLVFRVNLSHLSTSGKEIVRSGIAGAFSGLALSTTISGNTIVVKIANLAGIQYSVNGAGWISDPLRPGRDIDPEQSIRVRISLLRRSALENRVSTEVKTFSLDDIYQIRRAVSSSRMNKISSSLKAFFDKKLIREIANSPGTGLNSSVDAFVPWHWLFYGNTSSLATILARDCSKNAAGVCSNLSSSSYWRGGSNIRRGLIVNRIIRHISPSDKSISVDGFNNAIYVYPLSSQCSGSSYFGCSINAPRVPDDNYINTNYTPFSTVIYIGGYGAKSSVSLPWTKRVAAY